MKNILLILLFIASMVTTNAQNVAGYEAMLSSTYSHTVKQVKAVELAYQIESQTDMVILDTRELPECRVGKIAEARCVGYDNFDLDSVKDIDKDKLIYVYCSIGYRSERVGEMLQDNGYTRVFNLYGGIFNWVNNAYPLVNSKGESSTAVHGFDQDWSKWLNTEKCIIKLK